MVRQISWWPVTRRGYIDWWGAPLDTDNKELWNWLLFGRNEDPYEDTELVADESKRIRELEWFALR